MLFLKKYFYYENSWMKDDFGCQLSTKLPGNSQSPAGILALISTFPYLNENESCVRILALRIGFMINGMEPVRSQP